MSAHETVLVVVAAGRGLRFGADKLRVQLAGVSILARATEAVRAALPAARVVLVVRPDQVEDARGEWGPHGVTVVAGGARRQDSVRNGVEAASPADEDVAVIHDAARPFVPAQDILAVVSAAAESGAAVLVAPIADTVKRTDGEGRVRGTVPREHLVRALTPQAFRVGVLREAWQSSGDSDFTDEAALLESVGRTVVAVTGDPRNVKITTREDIAMLAPLFARPVRIGQGIDVHPFDADRQLWLGGVLVPDGPGLAGHSDADVVLHAVTDAILGACGGGDIGEHFPPTDERWRDARSERFVAHALELAREKGWYPVNCDVTILAERPRIGPHRSTIRASLAGLLGLPEEGVNVKATTTEGLGFVGREEGIVAMAVVTLESR